MTVMCMRYMQKLIFAKGAQARHERKVLIGPPSPFTQANIIHEMLNDHANLKCLCQSFFFH